MRLKNTAIGIIFIVLGVWFYIALSTFEVEEGTAPERIVIREGIIRTQVEIASALAEDLDFDLEGAYDFGYKPRDVIDYLINEPHRYSFTFYDGRYYDGRITAPYIIPFTVCIGMIVIGTVIIMVKLRANSGKS